MLTIQEVAKKIDRDQIAMEYFAYFYPDVAHMSNKNHTVRKIEYMVKAEILGELDRIINAKIQPIDDGNMVFFVGKAHDEGIAQDHMYFAYLAELSELGRATSEVQSYSCLLMSVGKIAGCYVSPDEYTQSNLAFLFASLLEEMSFFGSDEDKAERWKELNEAVDKIDSGEMDGELLSIDDIFPDRPKPDEHEVELTRKITEAEIELNQYYYAMAVLRARAAILAESKQDGMG